MYAGTDGNELYTYQSITIIIVDIIHFGDWILSPSSGGTFSVGPNRKS
jgi:hypothetical protein